MSAFGGWALSIVGIVMLGLLVDIVMPEGQTNKYIKSVFAVITVFVIAAPLPKLLAGGFNLDEIFNSDSSYEIDGGYIEMLNRQKAAALILTAETALADAGYTGVDISVTHETRNNELVFIHIFADVEKAEYKGSALNTNSTSGIKDILVNIFGIKREAISLYG